MAMATIAMAVIWRWPLGWHEHCARRLVRRWGRRHERYLTTSAPIDESGDVNVGDRPLAGKRIVVTRPAERGALATLLRMQGAEVIELPLIAIADDSAGKAKLAEAMSNFVDFDWIVVTSPAGAVRVAAELDKLRDCSVKLAAVGTGTAAALGRGVDLVPTRQIAEALVEVFPNAPPDDTGSVLVVRAADARSVVTVGLRAKGWMVDDVVAYRSVIVDYPELPPEAAEADAVLFASGSQVRAWTHNFGQRTPAETIAIGPVTAAVAAREGIEITAVAPHHSVTGLVEAAIARLGGR
jgi:uroporphyrinogen-III synthase